MVLQKVCTKCGREFARVEISGGGRGAMDQLALMNPDWDPDMPQPPCGRCGGRVRVQPMGGGGGVFDDGGDYGGSGGSGASAEPDDALVYMRRAGGGIVAAVIFWGLAGALAGMFAPQPPDPMPAEGPARDALGQLVKSLAFRMAGVFAGAGLIAGYLSAAFTATGLAQDAFDARAGRPEIGASKAALLTAVVGLVGGGLLWAYLAPRVSPDGLALRATWPRFCVGAAAGFVASMSAYRIILKLARGR